MKTLDSALGQVISYVKFRYDVLGRRIQKEVWDSHAQMDVKKTYIRKYVYDGDAVWMEFDGNNNLLAKYTHGVLAPDDVLSVEISSTGVFAGLASAQGKYYYLKDDLSSVIGIQNASGQVIQHYEYSSFGKIASVRDGEGNLMGNSQAVSTSYTFTGREWDTETGMYYFRARFYDPETGRFIQRDPHPGVLTSPSTVVNPYTYVSNRPTTLTDPSGRFLFVPFAMAFISTVAISAAIGAVTGGIISGLISANTNGGSFLQSFGQGFLSGAVAGAQSGALFGGGAFLVGAALPALFPALTANGVQVLSGLVLGAYGAAAGAQYGLGGILLLVQCPGS